VSDRHSELFYGFGFAAQRNLKDEFAVFFVQHEQRRSFRAHDVRSCSHDVFHDSVMRSRRRNGADSSDPDE
jgi:hypothetical protein